MKAKLRERDIEQYLVRQIEKIGGKAYKFSSPNNRAIPDRLCILPGGFMFFAELKALGKIPTPLQARVISFLRSLGATVAVIDSKGKVDDLINVLLDKLVKETGISLPNKRRILMHSDDVSDIISKIGNISGGAKQKFLKNYPDVKPYLLAAYDPFTNYYITPETMGIKHITKKGHKSFDEGTWAILKAFSTREVTGALARQMAINEYEELTDKSRRLFLGILNKNFRIGLAAKGINKVFKDLIPTHDVMLAKLFDAKKVKFPCYASVKIDGVRATYVNGKFYSRGGIVYEGLDHIFGDGYVVEEPDGELTVPGKSFQEGSGLIRQGGTTKGAIFNVFELRNINNPFSERLDIIGTLANTYQFVRKVPHKIVSTMEELFDYYSLCLSKGFEGCVVKPLNYKYKGTRSYDWMKMKPRDNLDLEVVSVYEGKGKYEGMLGGVRVRYNGNDNNGVGSGFSDRERKDFWDNPDLIIGKIIEVAYMEETDDGELRHASFKGIRHDKGGQ